MARIALNTTDAELHGLYEAVERTRVTSNTIKVERTALVHILRDHALMVATINSRGTAVDTPKET